MAVKEKLTKDSGVAGAGHYDHIVEKLLAKPKARGKVNIYSEKATKNDKIFIVNLTVCSNGQIDGEDFVNFCGLIR